MPCTNFVGMLSSKGLLECHHISNTSKETGNIVGSDENSEGVGISTSRMEGRLG